MKPLPVRSPAQRKTQAPIRKNGKQNSSALTQTNHNLHDQVSSANIPGMTSAMYCQMSEAVGRLQRIIRAGLP